MKQRIKYINWSVGIYTILLLVLLMPLAVQVQAADNRYWIGGDGDWSNPAKWDGGTSVPSVGDSAFLNSYGAATYTSNNPSLGNLEITAYGKTMTLSHTAGTLSILGDNSLTINALNGGTASYDLSGTGILVKQAYEVQIGTDGTGYFNQSGGRFEFSGALYLGEQKYQEDIDGNPTKGYGKYTMTGGAIDGWYGTKMVDVDGVPTPVTQTWYGGIVLGEWGGKGEFIQSGGTITVDDLTLARQDGSTGNYYLSGDPASSTLTVGIYGTRVGEVGMGTFVQSGGTHTTNGLVLGQLGKGTYNLSGDGSVLSVINNGDIYLGVDGTGTFIQSDKSNVAANNLFIGGSTGSGSYTQSGGSLSLAGVTIIGYSGAGTFTQTGGIHTVNGDLNLAQNNGSTGTYNLSAKGDLRVLGSLNIGLDGTGTFTQSGGTNNVEYHLVLGNNSTGIGTYNMVSGGYVDGDGKIVPGLKVNGLGLKVGFNGEGTFNQGFNQLTKDRGDGGFVQVNNLYVGGSQSGDPFGDKSSNPPREPVPPGVGPGTYNLLHGKLIVTNNAYIGYNAQGTFNQGYDPISDLSGNDSSHQVQGDLVLGNSSSGHGIYNQSGGTNTVTGNLIIANNGGTGTYNFSGGSLSAGNIFVNQGGLFKGIGTINTGTFQVNGGTVAPGVAPENSPGTLTINGNYTQAGGILEIELGGLGNHDILNITGNAKLDGTLKLLLFGTSYTPTGGDSFDVLFAKAITGGFTIDGSGTGWNWSVAYLDLTGDDGFTDTVRLTAAAPVPVPPTVWLLGSGLLGLFGLRRKFRKQ